MLPRGFLTDASGEIPGRLSKVVAAVSTTGKAGLPEPTDSGGGGCRALARVRARGRRAGTVFPLFPLAEATGRNPPVVIGYMSSRV